MQKFLLKEISNFDLEKEILNIGFDTSYAQNVTSKFEYKNLKIFDLTCAQANILKQTALSVGADCATHKQVITGKIEISDCILGGSFSQLRKIAQKLKNQPFGLKILAGEIENCLKKRVSQKTKIVGILNLTKDSFSDGGKYFNFDDAVRHLHELIEDGADIIDIGAESTKPSSLPVDANEQLNKLLPVLKYIKDNNISVPISIDTRSAKVAGECISAGANIINDVSGFDFDKDIANVIAQNPDIKIILQHSLSTPDVMQNSPKYENLIEDIYKSLKSKTEFAISCGISADNIIIDPGIGFGKTRENNLEIIKRWQEFKTLNFPVMLGISRKSFLDMADCTNEEKDVQTLALNSILISQGVDYIRVHNVKLHKKFQAVYG